MTRRSAGVAGSIPSRLFTVIALIAFCFVGAPARAGQGAAAVLAGVVVDAQGSTVVRAVVRLLDASHRAVRSTLSDDNGRFRIDTSGCTGCAIEASLGGFLPASTPATGTGELRLVLAIAPVRESVVVSATRDRAPSSQVGAATTVIDEAAIGRRSSRISCAACPGSRSRRRADRAA